MAKMAVRVSGGSESQVSITPANSAVIVRIPVPPSLQTRP